MRFPVIRVLCSAVLVTVFAASAAHAQAGACTTGPCVTTYHNDAARDGVNSQETVLNSTLFPAKAAANFGLLKPAAGGATGAVDGLIYAQPLYLSGVNMATTSGCAGTQNIVLVATENNSVYAFTWTYTTSAKSYSFSLTQCWALSLNQPGEFAMPFTALSVSQKKIPCNNLMPQSGITGTPVIDTSVTPPVMYVVSAHQTASLTYQFRLHAINVNSGTEVINGSAAPYVLSGIFNSEIAVTQMAQRPGLAMFTTASGNPNIYVSFGANCDIIPYSGYVAALTYNYATQSFAPVSGNWIFDTESGAYRNDGGVWMSGVAPAVDGSGNVYVAVGNGSWNGTTEFGESVVQLATTPAGLVASDFYTPNDFAYLNSNLATVTLCSAYGPNACPGGNLLTFKAPGADYDLGSGGVTLLSPAGVTNPVCGTNPELVAGGKEGVIYGLCYNPLTATPPQLMGGLDGCGYKCTTPSNPMLTACSQSSTPGNGYIAQCFQGVNAGETQANGSTNIFPNPGIRGGTAFWAGTAANPENYLYVAGSGAALSAYQMNPTTGAFNTVGAPAIIPKTFGYGTTPSLSWDGSNPGNALLWALNAGTYGSWQPLTKVATAAKPAVLTVYNPIPTTGSSPTLQELWASSAGAGNAGPAAVKFTVPTIAGGLVFVPGGTAGYAPGPAGGTNVNCTAAALANSVTPTVCGGQLSIYGKIHN